MRNSFTGKNSGGGVKWHHGGKGGLVTGPCQGVVTAPRHLVPRNHGQELSPRSLAGFGQVGTGKNDARSVNLGYFSLSFHLFLACFRVFRGLRLVGSGYWWNVLCPLDFHFCVIHQPQHAKPFK